MNELTFTKEEIDFLEENDMSTTMSLGSLYTSLEELEECDGKLKYELIFKIEKVYNNKNKDELVRKLWNTLEWDIEEDELKQFHQLVNMDDDNYQIDDIGNYYGGLALRFISKPQWSIGDSSIVKWKDIPIGLFKELLKFEIKRREEIR